VFNSFFKKLVLTLVLSVSIQLKAEPLWAYGFQTPLKPTDHPPAPSVPSRKPKAGKSIEEQNRPLHVAGSTASYSTIDIHYGGNVADWFPLEHPPMPYIASHGSKSLGDKAYACAFCHLPTGRGRPENAPVSGQSVDYFIRQLEDFKHGMRNSYDKRKANTQVMIALAKAMTKEEEVAAANYFAAIPWTRWVHVIETDLVPRTHIENSLYLALEKKLTEPIAGRIIEIPEDEEQAQGLRNPHSGFIAYVPKGSLSKGKDLVTSGGERRIEGKVIPGKTVACATCHGPDLMGLKDAPAIAGRSPSYLARQMYDMKEGTRKGAFAVQMQPVVSQLSDDDITAIVAYVSSLP